MSSYCSPTSWGIALWHSRSEIERPIDLAKKCFAGQIDDHVLRTCANSLLRWMLPSNCLTLSLALRATQSMMPARSLAPPPPRRIINGLCHVRISLLILRAQQQCPLVASSDLCWLLRIKGKSAIMNRQGLHKVNPTDGNSHNDPSCC